MRFLVDAQLPPALARWLREYGHEAEHVEDVGMRAAEDEQLWSYALKADVAIVTKDEDFSDRAGRDSHSPAVVWVAVGTALTSSPPQRSVRAALLHTAPTLDNGGKPLFRPRMENASCR